MVADVLYITLSNFIWFMMLHCVIVCYPAGPSIPQINVPNVPHIMARGSLWAQFFQGSLWAQNGLTLGTYGSLWAHMGSLWADMGSLWAQMGSL